MHSSLHCHRTLHTRTCNRHTMGQHTQPYPMAEIIEQSPGFKGLYTETSRDGSQAMTIHMVGAPHFSLSCCCKSHSRACMGPDGAVCTHARNILCVLSTHHPCSAPPPPLPSLADFLPDFRASKSGRGGGQRRNGRVYTFRELHRRRGVCQSTACGWVC